MCSETQPAFFHMRYHLGRLCIPLYIHISAVFLLPNMVWLENIVKKFSATLKNKLMINEEDRQMQENVEILESLKYDRSQTM